MTVAFGLIKYIIFSSKTSIFDAVHLDSGSEHIGLSPAMGIIGIGGKVRWGPT
jgi:hypothetical protein